MTWENYCYLIEKYRLSRGFASEWDLAILMEYVAKIPEQGVYVEIGVSEGSSILSVAKERPDVDCIGIEIEGQYVKGLNAAQQEDIKNITMVHGDSTDICRSWHKEVDMMFIDGDHYMPQVFLDVIGWLPFIKKDGYMLFHDFEKLEQSPLFHVHLLGKIFRGHGRYITRIPSMEENMSTSMMIVQKIW